jgi:gluconate 5-dehydrogenase
MNIYDLKGKRALITGGTHGLGMAMAKGLGSAGADLIINDLSKEKIDEALGQYKQAGLTAYGYQFDVTDDDAVRNAIDKIESEVGAIDVLINNAGIIKRIPMIEMETKDFRQVIDVNLIAPFIVSKYVGRNMIKRKAGKVINICSMMSELGRDTVSAYAAAKGGLKMLTRNMATEWGKYNVQVNGIGPGYFATQQTAPIRVNGHPFNDFIISRTPAGRWGEPEDLIGTTVFLASSASDYVNGQVIYVDGGLLATIGKPSNE